MIPSRAETKGKGASLLAWLDAHKLHRTAHLPILRLLGVQAATGTVHSLKPLRLLTFADLSAEVARAGEGELPCSPYCAADKAAVYEALQADLKRGA